ncbi:MAG: translocation/assembly module TamB domain-containing protein [Terriglobia bacterium]|jgi:translocation and assembly module TamB
MSKPFKITLVIIMMVVALASAAIAVMSTPWFRQALEHRLISSLEDATGGRVEVQSFRFHPFVLQATFQGLVLHGSESPEAPPLFSARTIVVRLSPANLLHREIRIMTLDWDGAELHLTTNPDGSTNLPGPLNRFRPGQVMGKLIDLRIGRVTLAHSTFFWGNRALEMDLSASDVALLLHLRSGRRYEGSLAVSAVNVRMPGRALPTLAFSSRFGLSQNEFAVPSLAWQFHGMAGHGSFSFHPLPVPQAYFSFQTSLDVTTLKPLLRLPGLQTGNVRLEGQGIYRQGELSVRGRVQSHQVLYRDVQFDSGPVEASADYSLDHSRVTISNLKMTGWGGSAQGEGQVSLAGAVPQVALRARLHDMNLAALLQSSKRQPRLIAQVRPACLVDGTVELTSAGGFEKVKSKFDLQLPPLAAPPAGALPITGSMQGSLEINRGFSVNLESSSFETPHSLLKAKGTLVESTELGEPPGRLQIQFETSQLQEWRSLLGTQFVSDFRLPLTLDSRAAVDGEILGSIERPEVRGSVRVGKFEYRGGTWDGLKASIAVSPDSLQVSAGQLSRGPSVLNVDGGAQLKDWGISESSQVRLLAQAQHTPLEGLKAAFGVDEPVSGEVSGKVNFAGTASSLTGSGDVKLENANIAGESFNAVSAKIRIHGSSLDLNALEVLKGRGRITGKAQVDTATRAVSCQLHGADFSLADFKRLEPLAGAGLVPAQGGKENRPHNALEGQASFDLEGSGTPDHIHFHSTGLVKDISIGGVEVGNLRVQMNGEGRDIRFQGVASGTAGLLSLEGNAQAGGDWPLQLQGQFVSLRLDPWARLFANNKFDAQVTASGSLKGTGSLRDASKLDVHSEIQTLEVSFPSLKWRNEHPVEVRYADNRISAQPFRMQGPATNLDVDGSLLLAGAPSFALNVQGVADATILSLVEPGLQASGQSRIKLSVTGSPGRPQMNGTVEIRDVGLEYPGLPLRLSGLNGEVQLEGERATVKSLRGISGGGPVTLDGFVTLALPPRFDLRVQLDQVRVRYPVDFISILGGTLRLEGTSERSQLHGDLALSQVLASGSKPWINQIMQSASPFEPPAPSTTSSLANSIRLNIRVATPTPVRLQIQDLRLTADVDVRVQGSLANPVDLGEVHFLDGEAVVRGNRFTLTRGDLNMTNPLRTQSTLDLEAQTRVQQYDLTVDVSGPPGRLKMTYRSDPPLPTEEVFSLLALGYAPQQQQGSTSGLVSSFAAGNPTQSVGESALLSQALSTQVGGRIQRLFGVSRIQIDPNVGLPGFNNGERITIEQQVTKDLTLTYITNTASSQYQIIQFEYAFGENISLLGVRDPNGIVGVELRFRRRFK